MFKYKITGSVALVISSTLLVNCAGSHTERWVQEIPKTYKKEGAFVGVLHTALTPLALPMTAVMDIAGSSTTKSLGTALNENLVNASTLATLQQTGDVISTKNNNLINKTLSDADKILNKTANEKIVSASNHPNSSELKKSSILKSADIVNYKTVNDKAVTTHGLSITWQNDKGHWFAEGPLQRALAWNGYKTEAEALKHASGSGKSTSYIRKMIIDIPYSASKGRRSCNVYKVGVQVDWKTKQAYTTTYNIRLSYPQLKGW